VRRFAPIEKHHRDSIIHFPDRCHQKAGAVTISARGGLVNQALLYIEGGHGTDENSSRHVWLDASEMRAVAMAMIEHAGRLERRDFSDLD
jgi:hypothetical protein